MVLIDEHGAHDHGFLRTERLVIRPWRLDEADRFFDIYRRIEVARWLSGRPMAERDRAVEIIEQNLAPAADNPWLGRWAVVPRATGIPAGTVLFKPLPGGDGEIEIGWHLHPDSWGKGFATEAAAAVLRRGLASGVEEVWAVTHPGNHRSGRVCERLGMRLLGVTHRWYDEPTRMFWIGSHPAQQPSLAPDEPAG